MMRCDLYCFDDPFTRYFVQMSGVVVIQMLLKLTEGLGRSYFELILRTLLKFITLSLESA